MLWILFNDTDNEIKGIFNSKEQAETFAEENYSNDKTWVQDAPDYTKEND